MPSPRGKISENLILTEGGILFPRLPAPDNRRFAVWIYENPIQPGTFNVIWYVNYGWDVSGCYSVPWADMLFTNGDAQIVEEIVRSGGGWDSSWSSLTPVERTIRMANWLMGHTNRECEIATQDAWWGQTRTPDFQRMLDEVLIYAIDQGEPAPWPQPQDAYDPTKNEVGNATGLVILQLTRLRGVIVDGVLKLVNITVP